MGAISRRTSLVSLARFFQHVISHCVAYCLGLYLVVTLRFHLNVCIRRKFDEGLEFFFFA